MDGCLPILGSDGVGVVPGHVHRRPPKPSLLLALRKHGVECRSLKVTERVQMDIARDFGRISRLGEKVAHGIRMRRDCPTRIEGESETLVFEINGTSTCQLELSFAKVPKHSQRVIIERQGADTRASLRLLHNGPALCGDHRFVDRHARTLEVNIGPPQSAGFASPHPCGRDNADECTETFVVSRRRLQQWRPDSHECAPSRDAPTGAFIGIERPLA